jgi:hypothetical protein
MKKGLIALAIMLAFAAAAFMTTGAVAQDTKSGKVDDVITLSDPTFKRDTKSPVEFNHKEHAVDYKIDCASCHHVYKDGKNVWKEGDKVAKCAECHTSARKTVDGVPSLYKAFHDNCRDCHKKEKKGPTKCNECHPK